MRDGGRDGLSPVNEAREGRNGMGGNCGGTLGVATAGDTIVGSGTCCTGLGGGKSGGLFFLQNDDLRATGLGEGWR